MNLHDIIDQPTILALQVQAGLRSSRENWPQAEARPSRSTRYPVSEYPIEYRITPRNTWDVLDHHAAKYWANYGRNP